MTPEEATAVQTEVSEAINAGQLIERLVAHAWGQMGSARYNAAADAAAALHNGGEVDLLALFRNYLAAPTVEQGTLFGGIFFRRTMPKLHSNANDMLQTIAAFSARPPGEKAYFPDQGFPAWCQAESSRPLACLELMKTEPEKFERLLIYVFHAGAIIDAPHFLREAIELARSGEMTLKRPAMAALGEMDLRADPTLQDRAIEELRFQIAISMDDAMTAVAFLGLLEIAKRTGDLTAIKASMIIVPPKAGPDTQVAMAQALWRLAKAADSEFIATILSALRPLGASNQLVLDQLDEGLSVLLSEDSLPAVAKFLESVVEHPAFPADLKSFDSLVHKLTTERPDLFGLLLVRALLTGSIPWRLEVAKLVRGIGDHIDEFDIDFKKMSMTDADTAFVCRKAIGHLPLAPVACASILISALRALSGEAAAHVAELLLDPLLINYPGTLQEYVKKRQGKESKPVAKHLEYALAVLQIYLKGLRAAGEVPELRASDQYRKIQQELQREDAAATWKAARAQSIFMSIIKSSMVLHSHQTAYYQEARDGSLVRHESGMTSHGVSIETPRLDVVDPLGLNYRLMLYRLERRPS
jgi:hypothetical protein